MVPYIRLCKRRWIRTLPFAIVVILLLFFENGCTPPQQTRLPDGETNAHVKLKINKLLLLPSRPNSDCGPADLQIIVLYQTYTPPVDGLQGSYQRSSVVNLTFPDKTSVHRVGIGQAMTDLPLEITQYASPGQYVVFYIMVIDRNDFPKTVDHMFDLGTDILGQTATFFLTKGNPQYVELSPIIETIVKAGGQKLKDALEQETLLGELLITVPVSEVRNDESPDYEAETDLKCAKVEFDVTVESPPIADVTPTRPTDSSTTPVENEDGTPTTSDTTNSSTVSVDEKGETRVPNDATSSPPAQPPSPVPPFRIKEAMVENTRCSVSGNGYWYVKIRIRVEGGMPPYTYFLDQEGERKTSDDQVFYYDWSGATGSDFIHFMTVESSDEKKERAQVYAKDECK